MKNIVELRDSLSGVFTDTREGKLSPQIAGQLNNCAGKVIASLRCELEYYNLRKEKPQIPFLAAM